MEGFTFVIALAAFGLVLYAVEQNKKLEKRIETLENKSRQDGESV